jgi:hypoxanthine phosphoribosyltransferase
VFRRWQKNILIVDDINDTGATLNWIMKDWQESVVFRVIEQWEDEIWNNNVRLLLLFDNLASNCNVKMDYAGEEVNKAENNVWIDFPYEDWWTK